MRRLRREEAAPMGSQHLPLAALYLLELLGEYPFWGFCRGYLGSGYKREDASIRSRLSQTLDLSGPLLPYL